MWTRHDLTIAFDRWIADPDRSEHVTVPSGAVEDSWPAAAVAYELADLDRPLAEATGAHLGLPVSATYAHAARLLWTLRHDTGSYPQAVRELARLDPMEFRRRWVAVDEAVAALRPASTALRPASGITTAA